MENIEINGNFITIRDTTFNLNELISFKPQSLVKMFFPNSGAKPEKLAEDFHKIIVLTQSERYEFAYTTQEERDITLRDLAEKIKIYSTAKTQAANPSKVHGGGGNISINVADSSNVNIVHQSSGITITTKQVTDAKDVIKKIRKELEQYKKEQSQEVEDISESLDDIEKKIDNKERVPKLTFKSLLETASNLSSVSSLAVTLGQIIGVIPPL